MTNKTFRTNNYKTDQEMIALIADELIADELIADTKKTHDMYFSYETIDALSHHNFVVSFNQEPNRKSLKTTIKLSDLNDPQLVKDILLEEISNEITRLSVELLVSVFYNIDMLAFHPKIVFGGANVTVRFSKEIIDDRVVINDIHLVAKANDFNVVIKAITSKIKSPFATRTLTDRDGELYVIATAPVYRNQYIERYCDTDDALENFENFENFEKLMLMMSFSKPGELTVNRINIS